MSWDPDEHRDVGREAIYQSLERAVLYEKLQGKIETYEEVIDEFSSIFDDLGDSIDDIGGSGTTFLDIDILSGNDISVDYGSGSDTGDETGTETDATDTGDTEEDGAEEEKSRRWVLGALGAAAGVGAGAAAAESMLGPPEGTWDSYSHTVEEDWIIEDLVDKYQSSSQDGLQQVGYDLEGAMENDQDYSLAFHDGFNRSIDLIEDGNLASRSRPGENAYETAKREAKEVPEQKDL